MSCQHEVSVTNFKSGETVSYSLVIIKGTTKNLSKSCQPNEIHACTNETTSASIIVDEKFKILLELSPGENLLELKYCSTIFKLTLKYAARSCHFSILPLYIICDGHGGTFQAPSSEDNSIASALKRITVASKLLQSVIAEKLFEENQGRKTFQLEDECRVFHSCLNHLYARKMSQNELWSCLAKEILSSNLEYERIKFLGFLSCTRYCGETYQENLTHDDILKMTEGYVALGGGGFALFGTACLYTWPEKPCEVIQNFENSSLVDRYKFMDDSSYRGTLGACFSTTLGSVLHELCHTLDLGHTKEGIMARGFDDIDKVFLVKKDPEDIDPQVEKLRLKKLVERRKEFFIRKTDEDDGAFWTKSCIMILAYHRWLNDFKPSERSIKYNPITKLVNSTAGLRVIELRRKEDEMVLSNWTFDSRILKYSFQLPDNEVRKSSHVLFVEDNVGNIFKHFVNI